MQYSEKCKVLNEKVKKGQYSEKMQSARMFKFKMNMHSPARTMSQERKRTVEKKFEDLKELVNDV